MSAPHNPAAFMLPPNAASLTNRPARLTTHRAATRRSARTHAAPSITPAPARAPPAARPPQMGMRPPAKRVGWLRVALLAAGTVVGGGMRAPRAAEDIPSALLGASRPVHAAVVDDSARTARPSNVIPLNKLGIKRDDFLSDRELRRRKTTQFSEAEEEIMELEEWEVHTQWFRDLQLMWAGLASVTGMFVLYKGGVLWENWIKEQERKDMEEEIELTGTFIDPRAVRKDEDEDDETPKKAPPKGPDAGPKPGDASGDGDNPPGGIESLERIFGKS